MENNDLDKTDLLEQALTRLVILLADKDITYHFKYENMRYDVEIKIKEI